MLSQPRVCSVARARINLYFSPHQESNVLQPASESWNGLAALCSKRRRARLVVNKCLRYIWERCVRNLLLTLIWRAKAFENLVVWIILHANLESFLSFNASALGFQAKILQHKYFVIHLISFKIQISTFCAFQVFHILCYYFFTMHALLTWISWEK